MLPGDDRFLAATSQPARPTRLAAIITQTSAVAGSHTAGADPSGERVACFESALRANACFPIHLLWLGVAGVVVGGTAAGKEQGGYLPILFCHGQYRRIDRCHRCPIWKAIQCFGDRPAIARRWH